MTSLKSDVCRKAKFHLARHVTSWYNTTRSTCRASQASRVERVEPCCSTSSTQPKCIGSTLRTCRVVSRRDVTSQVEFGLNYVTVLNSHVDRLLRTCKSATWKHNHAVPVFSIPNEAAQCGTKHIFLLSLLHLVLGGSAHRQYTILIRHSGLQASGESVMRTVGISDLCRCRRSIFSGLRHEAARPKNATFVEQNVIQYLTAQLTAHAAAWRSAALVDGDFIHNTARYRRVTWHDRPEVTQSPFRRATLQQKWHL